MKHLNHILRNCKVVEIYSRAIAAALSQNLQLTFGFYSKNLFVTAKMALGFFLHSHSAPENIISPRHFSMFLFITTFLGRTHSFFYLFFDTCVSS